MPTDLLIATILKALAELVGLFLLGRGATLGLAKFMRQAPERNLIYQLFVVLTKPVVNPLRAITPRSILDKHVPVVAFLLVFWVYLMAAGWKLSLCGEYAEQRHAACAHYTVPR
jgi:uncharacterized protein YggT (Ycf19 family)